MGRKDPYQKIFTATGESEPSLVSGGPAILTIKGDGGPFVGTIEVRRFTPGESTVESSLVETYTVERTLQVEDCVGGKYYFKCTAYTSGSILCKLEQ